MEQAIKELTEEVRKLRLEIMELKQGKFVNHPPLEYTTWPNSTTTDFPYTIC